MNNKINDNDFCINFGCMKICMKCNAYNKDCLDYESKNTRLAELNEIKNKNI